MYKSAEVLPVAFSSNCHCGGETPVVFIAMLQPAGALETVKVVDAEPVKVNVSEWGFKAIPDAVLLFPLRVVGDEDG
jgi:hypothetical protein